MPKYFVQDDHEAIISREMFNAAEEESARRRAKYGHASGEKSELSSKVCCGICGKRHIRKVCEIELGYVLYNQPGVYRTPCAAAGNPKPIRLTRTPATM